MHQALLGIGLFNIGRDAAKIVAGLTVAIILAVVYSVSVVMTLITSTVPDGTEQSFAAGHVLSTGSPPRIAGSSSGEDLRRSDGTIGAAPATNQGYSLAVLVAQSQLGRPYVWGGAALQAGFDCSGLVQWSYRQIGVSLPRTAQQQFNATSRLSSEQLQAGDLVFFQICCQPPDLVTHVGVYAGAGNMLHAPAPGEVVRLESISTPYWRRHWVGAGRVVAGTALPTGAPG